MTRDIFNTPVTIADLYGKNASVHTLGEFLTLCNHNPQLLEKVLEVRKIWKRAQSAWAVMGDCEAYHVAREQYKKLKEGLFVCKTSGVIDFDTNTWQSYSDVICLDIDNPKPHEGKRPQITDFVEAKKILSANPFVSYCGLSVGGAGLFVLIPVQSHERHREHWEALRQLFLKVYGWNIDPVTHDVIRGRFLSYDPHPVVNRSAQVFEGIATSEGAAHQHNTLRPSSAPTRRPWNTSTRTTEADTQKRVCELVQRIDETGTDITQNYDEWLRAAGAIAHYMGDTGRDLFHTIARQSGKYKERENDRLFTSLQRGASREAGLGSFFYLCNKYGVTIPAPRRAVPAMTRKSSAPKQCAAPPPTADPVKLAEAPQTWLQEHGVTEANFYQIMNINP